MRAPGHIAPVALLLGALALAAPARAQLQAEPLRLRIPDTITAAAAGPLADSAGNDLYLHALSDPADVTLVPWRRLLARAAPLQALDLAALDADAGFLGAPGAGPRADLVFTRPAGLSVAFGAAPGALAVFDGLFPAGANAAVLARLLDRAAPVVAAAVGTGDPDVPGTVELVDLASGGPGDQRSVALETVVSRFRLPAALQPIRLSDTARALGLHDLALPGLTEVQLVLHGAAPSGPGLAGLELLALRVGQAFTSDRLPPGVREGDVLGVAALDVDQDGRPDLVFSLNVAVLTRPAQGSPAGAVVWIRNTGLPADLDLATPWNDLAAAPAAAGLALVDPALLAPVELGGGLEGVVIWDRRGPRGPLGEEGDGELVLVWAEGGRLARWRGAVPGLEVEQVLAADVVGSPAPDLVVRGSTWGTREGWLLVFPDAGDAPPTLGWAAGSPGTAPRGEAHRLLVEAADAEGAVLLEWFVGGSDVPEAGEGSALTLPGALLCGAGPIPVRVRATDEAGLFREIEGEVTIALTAPALALAGASPPGRLVLPPGGATATFDGSAWAACGRPVTFTWGGTPPPAGSTRTFETGTGTARQILELPEVTYPELLSGDPVVTLAAEDDLGLQSPVATLPLVLDATSLVGAEHGADVAALAAGELALLRTRLESRLGVALPGVSVEVALAGLEPAGSPVVRGAAVASVRADGAEVVLVELPPAGTPVTLELPVRAIRAGGASAVEVRSSGGHLLTPPADAAPGSARLPGCGCGGGAASAPALLALLALLRPRRRR